MKKNIIIIGTIILVVALLGIAVFLPEKEIKPFKEKLLELYRR